MQKLIFSCLFLLFVNSNTFGQFSTLVEKTEKAIFSIVTFDEYGAPNSTGTGFFINPNGIGLTNLHVLEDAKYAFIKNHLGEVYPIIKIIRISKDCDIAEFSIENNGKSFPSLNINEEIPPKGSDIFVIGNPEGFEGTVSKGIVSAIRNETNKIIQITAPISPGSSGSPIMNMNGQVFGIATYQAKEGQNLNFGYWIGCKENLVSNNEYKLANSFSGNFFALNQICKTEKGLILNSIEKNEKNTVLNFTYTNTSLAWGDDAYIFTTIGDKEKSFYIEDFLSGKKYFAYDATIGNSPQSPTILKLGESKRFKIFFPPIENSFKINIKEGMQGADWSFSNIDLKLNQPLKFENANDYNEFYYQTGLKFLSHKEYSKAYIILKDYSQKNNENDFAHNLAGIISHVLGNNLDAYTHLKKAIDISPMVDKYYFNLCYINVINGNIDEALRNISSAIQINDDQPEYYEFRGQIYLKKQMWKETINDYSKFISSDRGERAIVYFNRAIAKLHLNDKSACKDFEKAYDLENNSESKKTIKSWYQKYCK